MDFRTEVAVATGQRLAGANAKALVELAGSGCVPVPGGQRALYLVELPHVFISTGCLLLSVAALPLFWMGMLTRPRAFLLLLLLMGSLLMLRMVRGLFLKLCLRGREEGLLKLLPQLPAIVVGIEEGKTHKKLKLVIEDRAVCLLDAERRRVLIEGCVYRYVICAGDVLSVQPVSGYALSGARLNCRMAGQPLDLVLMADGFGPLASLVQAFNPSSAATGLASTLNRTLFGAETPAYQQRELPPSLPSAIALTEPRPPATSTRSP
jgi:hypothetical protein